jgi:hypothetical protein
MLIRITTSIYFKPLAVFLALSLVVEIFSPSMAYALTGGPSQPEVETFEPIGTNQMVDLLTGDFNYNIHLLTVPGTDGGYPINLAYHAGIGMEQEASWVGLGWNINPGVINRNMRGLPDDFNGEKVIKEQSIKPDRTFGIGVDITKLNSEVFGLDLPKSISKMQGSYQLYYNTYRGVGQQIGLTMTAKEGESMGGSMAPQLGLNFDSQTGLSISPSLSFSRKIENVNFQFSGGATFHSREGFTGLKFSSTGSYLKSTSKGIPKLKNRKWDTGSGAGISFVGTSTVPSFDFPRTGGSYEITVKGGNVNFGTTVDLDIHLSYGYTELAEKSLDFPAYGFMYSENAISNSTLMDFNREKAVQITQKNKSLPIPIQTQDIYAVAAQGIGGTFRPYRSDIGKYRDGAIFGSTDGWGGGAELDLGPGPQAKTGVNAQTSFTSYYSGDWSGNNGSVSHFKFRGKEDPAVSGNRFYEPVYFKNAGEQLLSNQPSSNSNPLYSDMPMRFTLGQVSEGLAKRPVVKPIMKNPLGGSSNVSSGIVQTYSTTRERKSQNFEYLTRKELKMNSLPNTNYTAGENQMAEISILNPEGQRYVFGLPAYNYEHTDYMFSVEHTGNAGDKLTTYTTNDRTSANSKGSDNFYTSTKLPPYAHSYMLTQIQSADYVDLTGNGPSDDDLGSYTKFTYNSAHNNYEWRTPYNGEKANLMIGHYSDFTDDKASFSYGVKDVYYLDTIETKTHKAVFVCTNRADAMGVGGLDGGSSGGKALKKLDKIILYSKANPNVPIKTVHFAYDYSLCKSIPNSSMAGEGKLTLLKVWFTYSDYNTKSKLNPYEFNYNQTSPDANPTYDYAQSNRWGFYQPNKTGSGVEILSHENPYVNQRSDYDYSGNTCNIGDATDELKRNLHASAWCLRKITLPSGGEINIDYESDDYAYVQNKKAMQMCRIVNTGSSSGKKNGKINASNRRIYFELETPISTSDPNEANLKLARYFEDVKEIYFKAFVKLKRFPSGTALSGFPYEINGVAYDYIEGYAEKESVGFDEVVCEGGEGNYYTTAWVDLKDVPINDKGTLGEGSAHPISKAAWQSLRLKRPDLFKQPNTPAGNALSLSALINFSSTAISILKEAAKMLLGFYTYAKVNGYGNEILLSGSSFKPSYIRLNKANGIKYGGGHRVKQIALNDNWNNMTNALVTYPDNSYDYGQEYAYRLPDGRSSGVAEYEPLIGGEENPFRKPVRYSTDNRLVSDLALYIEEPYNENYFPSPGVGYSRVEVRSLKREHNSQPIKYSTSGVNVHEFYTAKDYPVISLQTSIEKTKYNKTIYIPFLGSKQYNNNGYSQGYSIELNDMHGKAKSVANYSSFANLKNDLPVTRTDYIYATVNDYNPNKVNRLKSEVTVLTQDGAHQQGEIGKHVEMFMDMREDKVESEHYGVSVNLTVVFGLPIPLPIPNFSLSDAITRTVVTNKVITRNGILERMIQYNEGQKIVTDNLMFDAETGQPLLTSVTNDFGDPIYTYNYASHWYYDGMGGAYKNYGVFMNTINTAYLFPGDILLDQDDGKLYWVEATSPNLVLKDNNDATVTTPPVNVRIIRSGRRNLQSTSCGKIVTLDNIASASPDFLVYYNTILVNDPNAVIPGEYDTHLTWDFHNCATGLMDMVDFYGDENTDKLFFSHAASPCGRTIDVSPIPNFWANWKNYVFTYSPVTIDCQNSTHQLKATNTSNGVSYTVNFTVTTSPAGTSPCACFKPCLRVLHAEAYTFKHAWDYNYENEYTDQIVAPATIDNNPYRYGKQGIWRMEDTYNYIEKRLLTRNQLPSMHEAFGTKINKDGEYDIFVPFQWPDTSLNAKQWNMLNRVSKYSPYGYALEAHNALDVYSSELYGYNRSAVIASASNAKYHEIAFDGFEDYKNNQYGNPFDNGHGNLVLLDPGLNFNINPDILTSTQAHTGKYSIQINPSSAVFYGHIPSGNIYQKFNHKFKPETDNKYMLSVWVKSDHKDVIPEVKVMIDDGNWTPITTLQPGDKDSYIDGWYKLDAYFDIATMNPNHSLILQLGAIGSGNGKAYFDDIRIHPVKAQFKSYVYDPLTMRLSAELDENNYATFFVYDVEGKVTQVKKETEKGTLTLKENRTKFKGQ